MDDVFFVLSKTLGVLVQPLPLILILSCIVSLFIGKKLIEKIILIAPIFLLWLLSSFQISNFLINYLENEYPPIEIKDLGFHKVTVVLGGSINNLTKYTNQIELNSSAERLFSALNLYNNKKTEIILFTGGSGALFYNSLTESDLAKKFFFELGVNPNNLVFENESRNTKENAKFTKEILDKNKLNQKVILITSAFHMGRSVEIFKKYGIEVTPFPCDFRAIHPNVPIYHKWVPNTSALENSSIAIKEYIGRIIYKLI